MHSLLIQMMEYLYSLPERLHKSFKNSKLSLGSIWMNFIQMTMFVHAWKAVRAPIIVRHISWATEIFVNSHPYRVDIIGRATWSISYGSVLTKCPKVTSGHPTIISNFNTWSLYIVQFLFDRICLSMCLDVYFLVKS